MSQSTSQRPPLLSFDEARERLLSFAVAPTVVQRVPLIEAASRVLAEPVSSPMDVPGFDNSAMDGYAIYPKDVTAQPLVLNVTQRIPAGANGVALAPGEAARIFTGAPVPQGTYAVVPQEDVSRVDDQISIEKPIEAHQFVRNKGEDIAAGAQILKGGRRLQPADMALAASVGVTHVSAFKPLTVAILLTGDELVEPGRPLAAGQIYNSNRYWLHALLTQIGCQVVDPGIVRDTPEQTRDALKKASQIADVVITCGGVSVGEEDHVRAAVESMGHIDLWQIAMKPGKPLAYGKANGADFIGLPGNPVSAFVTFVLMGLPFLYSRMGLPVPQLRPETMVASFDWPKPDRRREFIRVRKEISPEGHHRLARWPNQGSGVMSSVAWADGLVDIAPGQTIVSGQTVPYLAFSNLLNLNG
jgi:molybdopterin molybdotransferase